MADGIISGNVGMALVIDGGQTFVIRIGESGEPEESEVALETIKSPLSLFGEAKDLLVIEGVSKRELMAQLTNAQRNDQALQLVLALLDPQLSTLAHSKAGDALEDMLVHSGCRAYLEAVLTSHPLPDEAFHSVNALSSHTPEVFQLLKDMESRQAEIALVWQEWESVSSALSQDERIEVRARLVRAGLFRDLVDALFLGRHFSISEFLHKHPDLRDDGLPSLLNSWSAQLPGLRQSASLLLGLSAGKGRSPVSAPYRKPVAVEVKSSLTQKRDWHARPSNIHDAVEKIVVLRKMGSVPVTGMDV